MKIRKTILAVIAAAVIALAYTTLSPKLENYLAIKKIEQKNRETMEQIQKPKPRVIYRAEKAPEKTEVETFMEQMGIIVVREISEEQYLPVQFICQAPLETEANWVYHEESCEEAAVLQAYLYETGQTMTKQEAHEEILKMIEWQEGNLGSHRDLYAPGMKEFITGYYGIGEEAVKIIEGATLDDIKHEIAAGHPVIVPVTSGLLNNPYYPHPGYHMLTAIGYTKDRIITNDNGTRHGADFSYANEVFDAAMRDGGGFVMVLKGI